MPPQRQALRRYPALAFLAVAAILAVALPSALTIPNAGPPTLAEFAPVPGQGHDAGGDLGRLGSGSSGDVGFGSGDPGAPGQPPLDPGQPGGDHKRCVGAPPRQTEDPLSPPCVAFFAGDNFGATARGVTADEIKIVIDLGFSAEYQLIDFDDPEASFAREDQNNANDVVRAYSKYFNERYQLFGRRAHFFGLRAGNGPEAIRAAMTRLKDEVGPFAVVSARVTDSLVSAREAARAGMLAISYAAFDRRLQRQLAPLLLSFIPDLQDEARIAASFVCRKLEGRVARFSGNASDQSRARTFGIAVRDDGSGPERPLLADLIAKELERGCGLKDLVIQSAGEVEQDAPDYTLNMAAFQREGITSVIAIGTSESHLFWGNAGFEIGYLPEWIIPGTAELSGPDQNEIGRQMPPPFWRNAFGVSYQRRIRERETQPWYQAFREGCSTCTPPAFAVGPIYDELTLLFWGIQAAGPRLTPENIDKGLHAIPHRPSASPDIPAAYFAPGNYSFVKDALATWWDGSQTEPGTNNPGCYRVARAGKRYRAGEWTQGDRDLFTGSMPCQGPSR